MAVIIGIDSDAKGAIALLDTTEWSLNVYPLPNIVKKLKSGKNRLNLDFLALGALMQDLISPASVVWVEDQWSRPSQDIGAMFTFGMGFGDIRSAVAGAFLRHGLNPTSAKDHINFVPAADWKLAMGASSDKAQTRALATKLFPECAYAWKLVSKHTSAAEASLLALYGASRGGFKIPRGTIIQPYSGLEKTNVVPSLTRKR